MSTYEFVTIQLITPCNWFHSSKSVLLTCRIVFKTAWESFQVGVIFLTINILLIKIVIHYLGKIHQMFNDKEKKCLGIRKTMNQKTFSSQEIVRENLNSETSEMRRICLKKRTEAAQRIALPILRIVEDGSHPKQNSLIFF